MRYWPHLPLRPQRSQQPQRKPAASDEEAAAQQHRDEGNLRQQDEDDHHHNEADGRVAGQRVEVVFKRAHANRVGH